MIGVLIIVIYKKTNDVTDKQKPTTIFRYILQNKKSSSGDDNDVTDVENSTLEVEMKDIIANDGVLSPLPSSVKESNDSFHEMQLSIGRMNAFSGSISSQFKTVAAALTSPGFGGKKPSPEYASVPQEDSAIPLQ